MDNSQLRIGSSTQEAPATLTAAQSVSIVTIAFFVVAIFGYVFNVALGWLLSVEEYGLYGVSVAFLNVLTIFISLGFPWAAAKLLSADENQANRYKILRSCLSGNLLVALGSSALFYALYSLFLPDGMLDRQLILMLIAILLISAPTTIYLGAFQGLLRFKQMGAIQILIALLRLVAGIGLVQLGYDVLGALAGYLIGGIVALIAMVYLLRGFKFWRGRGWFDSRALTFAPAMFFGLTGLTLLSNLDILGLRTIGEGAISSQLAGYYQSALILARIPFFVSGAMTASLFPFMSRATDSGGREYSITALKYVVLFIFPLAIAIALKPASFITLFFPEAYAAGAEALAVVAIGMGFLSVTYVLTGAFQALGKPWIPALVLMAAAAVQVGVLMILVPRWGLVGAAASTTIACFLGMSWLLLRYLKVHQVSLSARPVLSLVAAFGATGGLLYLLPLEGRLLTLLGLLLTAVVYGLLLLLLRLIDQGDVEIWGSALPSHKVAQGLMKQAKGWIVRFNNVL